MIIDYYVNLTTMNDIVCSVLCAAVQHGERAHRGARHVRVLRAQRPGVRTLLLLRRLRDQGQNLLGDTEDTEQQQQVRRRDCVRLKHLDDDGAAVAPLAGCGLREGEVGLVLNTRNPTTLLLHSCRNLILPQPEILYTEKKHQLS